MSTSSDRSPGPDNPSEQTGKLGLPPEKTKRDPAPKSRPPQRVVAGDSDATALGPTAVARKPPPPPELLGLVSPSLRRRVGRTARRGAILYDAIGAMLVACARVRWVIRGVLQRRVRPAPRVAPGPDGTRIVYHGLPIPGNAGTTYGRYIHWMNSDLPLALLNHEYVHVLQVRRDGFAFLARYLAERVRARWRGGHPYWDNGYEKEALAIERCLRQHPSFPNVWELEQDDR